MSTFLWVLQWLLAAVFLLSGGRKLTASYEAYTAQMTWAKDFAPGAIKGIGGLEVLAALGLIAAPLLDIAPILAPLAGIGLALLMVGAAVVHRRHGETQMIVANIVIGLLAAVVAWGRLGPSPF